MLRRHSKYNAIKVEDDGHTFDSKQEHKRYCSLKILLRAGLIFNLRVHPKFDIEINHKHFCFYTGDFDYLLVNKGYEHLSDDDNRKKFHSQYVLEDVKAMSTTAYRLQKKALFLDKGITITEINVLKKRKRNANYKNIKAK